MGQTRPLFLILVTLLVIMLLSLASKAIIDDSISATELQKLQQARDCKLQRHHCNTAEAYWHMDALEADMLSADGPYKWYWKHEQPKHPIKQRPGILTVASNGAAHWGVK